MSTISMRMECSTILDLLESAECGRTHTRLGKCKPSPALLVMAAKWTTLLGAMLRIVALRTSHTHSLAWTSAWNAVSYQHITRSATVNLTRTWFVIGTWRVQPQARAGLSWTQGSTIRHRVSRTRPSTTNSENFRNLVVPSRSKSIQRSTASLVLMAIVSSALCRLERTATTRITCRLAASSSMVAS